MTEMQISYGESVVSDLKWKWRMCFRHFPSTHRTNSQRTHKLVWDRELVGRLRPGFWVQSLEFVTNGSAFISNERGSHAAAQAALNRQLDSMGRKQRDLLREERIVRLNCGDGGSCQL